MRTRSFAVPSGSRQGWPRWRRHLSRNSSRGEQLLGPMVRWKPSLQSSSSSNAKCTDARKSIFFRPDFSPHLNLQNNHRTCVRAGIGCDFDILSRDRCPCAGRCINKRQQRNFVRKMGLTPVFGNYYCTLRRREIRVPRYGRPRHHKS